MKIDLTQVINDSITGEPMAFGANGICPTCGEVRNPKDITMRFVMYHALTAGIRGDDQLTGDQKSNFGMLADAVAVCNEIDLNAKDLGAIQERVERVWGNLVVFKFRQIIGHKPSGSPDDKPAGKRLSK